MVPSRFPKHLEKSVQSVSNQKGFQLQGERFSMLTAVPLAQLQDWNCRKQFTSLDDLHARDAVEGRFSYTKAGNENPIVSDLLKQTPLLVPFTKRVQNPDLYFSASLGQRKQKLSHSLLNDTKSG